MLASTTATQKLEELRAVARTLWPDRDDAEVASELNVVLAEIRKAEEQERHAA